MRELSFSQAIDDAMDQVMATDDRVIILGEDVHTLRRNLFIRYGAERVRATPISEAAFVGAAVSAAMAGLRPVVEVMLVDFLAVAMDAILNHAAKVETFSGGKWRAPLVVRATCGGGYGDGGQHEQTLWGWLAHIPGLSVVVPSTPADAGALMMGALAAEGPVIFLEHKLLSETWRDYLGAGGRTTVSYDVPAAGERGPVPDSWQPLAPGKSVRRRAGDDLTIVSIGLGVHRALEAAEVLGEESVAATVIDLRSVAPLDQTLLLDAVSRSGRLLVVDEDYEQFGLSGELAARVMEAGLTTRYARVCTQSTIPYDRRREDQVLPNVERILAAARELLQTS